MGLDIATGITIVFGTSGWAPEIIDVTAPPWSREAVQSSHQGTTVAHTHEPADLGDWGELEFTYHWDPSTEPPHIAAAETITLTWPDNSTQAFTGFLVGLSASATLNAGMVGTATVKISGDITFG